MKPVARIPRASVANGAMVRVSYPPYDVLVAEIDGVPYAIEDACNHAGASLTEGWRVNVQMQEDPTGPCIACPVHGYIFSLETGHLIQPASLCDHQRKFTAQIEGDEIIIQDPFVLKILR